MRNMLAASPLRADKEHLHCVGDGTPNKKTKQFADNDPQRRRSKASTCKSCMTKQDHGFRFPRLASSSRKKSKKMTSSPSSPNSKSSRRLRSFPVLLRAAARRGRDRRSGEVLSETEDMTETPREGNSAMIVSYSRSSGGCSSSSTSNSTACSDDNAVVKCTKIVTVQQQEQPEKDQKIRLPDASSTDLALRQSNHHLLHQHRLPQCCENYSCATAILQHSYLEAICGPTQQQLSLESEQPPSLNHRRRIPDDPTVQDSIECVFASQLEEGLPLWEDDDGNEEDNRHVNDITHHNDSNNNSNYKQEPLPHNIYTYNEEPINAPSAAELPSPATLMQSRQKSRTPLPTIMANVLIPSKRRAHPSNTNAKKKGSTRPPKAPMISTSPTKHCHTAKMVHVGTFDPRSNRLLEVAQTDHNLMEEDPQVKVTETTSTNYNKHNNNHNKTSSCLCHHQSTPVLPPELWPQGPLLLRPTPNTGMAVHGVRFSGKSDPFWTPAQGGWWTTALYELADQDVPSTLDSATNNSNSIPPMCEQCCVLPINNGNEPLGEALVVDFSTPLFEGSMMLRLRHVEGGATSAHPDCAEYNDDTGYFAGLNRRYQVVIRGKFRQEMPMTELVSGLVMDRPAGRLPPKWIVKGAVKVLSFFAPQLEVQMSGETPLTLAPLGSTPQALIVQQVGPNDVLLPLDQSVEEPTRAEHSLLRQTYPGNSSLQRARGRKKAFDKLYAAQSQEPKTQVGAGATETYYTFEFLQHLVNFQDFSVELGSLLGSIPIAPILNGHPLPITAMTKECHDKLWSFDIWHQGLVQDAENYDAQREVASDPKKRQTDQ